jgi:hypothetical protein
MNIYIKGKGVFFIKNLILFYKEYYIKGRGKGKPRFPLKKLNNIQYRYNSIYIQVIP